MMEHLQIARSKDTLAVDFNAETGVLALEGSSYPENPLDFFDPLIDWFTRYTQNIRGSLTVNITIDYLNTSSSKCLLDFLEMLDKYHQSGGAITLNWYYEEDDEDMQETGEELCEDLELPCTMIPL
jgi:hypothetical protein